MEGLIVGIIIIVALALIIYRPKQVIMSMIALALLGTVSMCGLFIYVGASQ